MTPPANTIRPALAGMTPDGVAALCEQIGQPSFRAKQIIDALYRSPALSFDEVSTLPKGFRTELPRHAAFLSSSVAQAASSVDGTDKLLIRLHDGECIEAVCIPEQQRITCCLSSQVGCGLNCMFCASCKSGLARNLSAAEIVEQALLIHKRELADDRDRRRSPHIVMMGVGEPLANYDNVLAAIRILNSDWALNIGARKFTISTIGLPDEIRKLALEDLQLGLAISLHAPNDRIRSQIVPANRATGIRNILAAARDFHKLTHRQVTYEYVLIDGMNADLAAATQLARLLRPGEEHVNLIPLNPLPDLGLRPPHPKQVNDFADALKHAGLSVTIRKRRGSDIAAACGQLRRISHRTR